MERIKRHDAKVRERWEALCEGDSSGIVSEYTKKLLADGSIKCLPMFPLTSRRGISENERTPEKMGMFQQMARNHMANKNNSTA